MIGDPTFGRRSAVWLSALFGMLLGAVWAIGGARGQRLPYRPFDQEPYTHAQALVALPSGRHLNLYCTGAGAPAVILDAGLGGPHTVWALVQPAIARFTKVCSYDRAGQGFSDAGPLPRDTASIVSDLHDMLHAARIAPPYVFVGHSIAGLAGVMFADRYLDELAGMVLVDPSFADQTEQLDQVPGVAAVMAKVTPPNVAPCVSAAEAGKIPTVRKLVDLCLDHDPHYGAALNAANDRIALRPEEWSSVASELGSFRRVRGGHDIDLDTRELDAARRDFADLDLIVLTAGAKMPPPGLSTVQEAAARRLWIAGHDAIAARSTRGRNQVVPGSGHYIQIERPEVVIQAVRNVVNDARKWAKRG